MRVLVTGGGSFVGRNALPLLCASHEVFALARRPIADGLGSIPVVCGDLAATETYAALPQRMDAIIHLAAASSPENHTVSQLVVTNVVGMQNLLRYARAAQVSRFIYASTLSIYGRIEGPVVSEATPISDPDAYGLTKYLGEKLLEEAGGTMMGLSIRLPGVVGPGAHRNWLSNVLRRVRSDEVVAIFRPEGMFNNAVHVADLSRFLFAVLAQNWKGHEAVVLGADGALTVRQVVDILIAECGSRSAVTELPPSKPSFTISSDHARSRFGYVPASMDNILRRYAHDG